MYQPLGFEQKMVIAIRKSHKHQKSEKKTFIFCISNFIETQLMRQIIE